MRWIFSCCAVALFAVFAQADEALDRSVDAISPDVKKWATVCRITRDDQGKPSFHWTDYRDTGTQGDFWPASTVKLYTAVAALELLAERGFPLETVVTFEHRDETSGAWTLDSSRTVKEMLSEVFVRSSNEDYTLLLRMPGIDRINRQFFTPGKGFQRTALMRGYVLGRPWVYNRPEPQRVRLRTADGLRAETLEHTWTGHSYSADRGATIIDSQTGNITTTRDLVECMRRILFHELLPTEERFQLTPQLLAFLRHGGDGLTGLENKSKRDGAYGWYGAADQVFPLARYYHKTGRISTYASEIGAVDDRAQGGPEYIFAAVAAAGSESKPVEGSLIVTAVSKAIAQWIKAGGGRP